MADGAFRDVEVKAVSEPGDEQENTLTLELTQNGVAVLETSTITVSEAGEGSRLLMKVGDAVISAVRVMEPLHGEQLIMRLPDGLDASAIADEIRRQ
ncbi:hypothetical protein [Microbacterium excoecariae]|uniref:hypothetical protein n=1 Tax=Microbacterium excoecariae TaxID=2715210 RepID=UPI00197B106A|nr:hypothetical protein [Microbacterium excoecariae]